MELKLNWWSMSVHATNTMIGCCWSDIHEVCGHTEWQQIIMNYWTTVWTKEQLCILMEGQKLQEISQGLKITHDQGQHISYPIAYLRGMKEIMYSYVQQKNSCRWRVVNRLRFESNICGGCYYGGKFLIQHLTQPLIDDLIFFSSNIFNYMCFSLLTFLDFCIVARWPWPYATRN